MNAVTSGPTPTPAAATVAACSTSRLMPSRWVSLPASRRTNLDPSGAPVTRKFRLVMPPESAMNVSSPRASSGRRRSARVSSSRSSPRSSLSSSSPTASVVISRPPRSFSMLSSPPIMPESERRVGVAGAPFSLLDILIGSRSGSDRKRLRDHRLAGGHVRLHAILTTALRDEVIDQPNKDHQADERLEDGPRRQVLEDIGCAVGVLAEAQERVDERVRPRVAEVVAEVSEQCRIRPDADVDDHHAAPNEGEDVDDRAPAPEREPGALVRPALAAGNEDAEVTQEVAEVDHSGCGNGHVDRPECPGQEQRDRAKHADRDRRIDRRLEGGVDVAPQAAQWQASVATHREHEPHGRPLY